MVISLPPRELIIGLDLGQQRDYSAIVVLELAETATGARDPRTYEFIRERVITMRHAERVPIGTPYGGVVDRVAAIVHDQRLRGCTLVADATGVGAPVVEFIRSRKLPCRLIAAQITGGAGESSDGRYHRVPKRDLIVGLQVLIDQWKLQLPAGKPWSREIIRELQGIKAKRSGSGNFRYEGQPDDLAMALALAWWWMRKHLAWRNPQSLAA